MSLFNDGAVGFTGTGHQSLTANQRTMLRTFLANSWLKGFRKFHHGDCVFADVEAAALAWDMGYDIHIHPPTNQSKRGFFGQNLEARGSQMIVVYPEKPYLERNHDIVDDSDLLIACPKESTEQLRSGTWATVRYARKRGKQVNIFYPTSEAKL